jgi:hypothetical protein
MSRWLGEHRNLRPKHPEARILSCHGHLDGLGYWITRSSVEALPQALRHLGRQVALAFILSSRRVDRVDLGHSIAASAGHLHF